MKRKKQRIRDGFVPVPYPMIESDSWKRLSGIIVKLYIEILKRNWKSKNDCVEFIIPYSYYKDRIPISKPVFYKSIRELVNGGFLEKTELGGLFGKAAKYKFSNEWTNTNRKIVEKRIRRNSYRTLACIGNNG